MPIPIKMFIIREVYLKIYRRIFFLSNVNFLKFSKNYLSYGPSSHTWNSGNLSLRHMWVSSLQVSHETFLRRLKLIIFHLNTSCYRSTISEMGKFLCYQKVNVYGFLDGFVCEVLNWSFYLGIIKTLHQRLKQLERCVIMSQHGPRHHHL